MSAGFDSASLTTSFLGSATGAGASLFATTGSDFSAEIFGASVGAAGALGSKSILPTCLGPLITALALINSKRWRSSSCLRLSSISFSLSKRRASFSFLISSLIPFEASLLPLSPANWPQRILYTSSEIFVLGLASIAIPLSLR